MSSGGRDGWVLRVGLCGLEGLVDGAGDLALEGADGFLLGLAVGLSPQVVGAAGAVNPDLGRGVGGVGGVEVAFAAAGEPVAVGVPGGCWDRGGTGVGGVAVAGGEAGDVGGLGQELGGGEVRAAEQVQQLGTERLGPGV